jgi:sugar phosphate isomerase/epimerase
MLGGEINASDLAKAAECGVTHLELLIPPDQDTCATGAEFARIADLTADAGMTVWSVHAPFAGGVDLSAPDEMARRDSVAQIQRACKVADRLGANYLVTHAGLTTGDEEEQDLRRRQSLRSLNSLLKLACRLGVRVAVEYLPANKPRLCNDSAEICDFLDLCDGTPGVCLDTNHANLREGLADVTRALADRICTLHLSDNDGEQERHQMPGTGVIDWREFMAVLDEIDYDGPLIYEARGGETVAERMEMTVRSAREELNWEGPDG